MTTETNAERLEVLKRRYKTANVITNLNGIEIIGATREDVGWLIEQAERAQKLESMRSIVADAHQANLEKLEAENDRLRRGLEIYADKQFWKKFHDENYGTTTLADFDYGTIAHLALSNDSTFNVPAVKVIKKRGERIIVIEYNGERYVYQSDSTARGGKVRKGDG